MSAHKAGVAGGVFVMIGMAFARVGDNCAVVASRSGRLASEASSLDDVARIGRRGGDLGDVARIGRRGGDLGDVRPPLGHRASGHAGEFAVDLTIEVVRSEPDEFPGVTIVGETRCPRVIDLTTPSAWDSFKAGLGVACDPVIVTGLTRAPETLLLHLKDEPIRELAQDCTLAGSTCVFVGCAPEAGAECLEATAASLRATKLDSQLAPYLAGFVRNALGQSPAPEFLAQLVLGEGRLRLVVTRPRGVPAAAAATADPSR